MKLTVRRTPAAVHLCDETGKERYRLSRRLFHNDTLLSDFTTGQIFSIKEKEQPHAWNKEGEILCTLADMKGKPVFSARIRFEKEQMPPAPYRHGELLLNLSGRPLRVERKGETDFRLLEDGRETGRLDCGNYSRPGHVDGPEDGLSLAALLGWCLYFQQADCQITV